MSIQTIEMIVGFGLGWVLLQLVIYLIIIYKNRDK
jgi:hypothetical protein